MSLSPKVISIYHDGLEVAQISNGQTVYLQQTSSGIEPQLLEFYWDGVLVYRLKDGIVELNTMNLEAV
jgi:hypothetical protein